MNKVKLTAESIAAAPRLGLVAVAATGTDNVDLAACQARGIVVRNIRGYATHTVPEHTFAVIFALRRSIWLDRPNFFLTPHVAWASGEAVQALADQLIGNLEAYARELPSARR